MRTRAVLLIAAVAASLAALVARPAGALAQPADNVSSEQVANAIQKALPQLKQGLSAARANDQYMGAGTMCLQVLALINAGVPVDDPALAKALTRVEAIPNTHTYVMGLKIQALAAADPKKYLKAIQDTADALVKGQTDVGMWSYGAQRGGGRGDNSNSQFALLGLHEAAKAGAKIPQEVWDKALRHYVNTQLNDGGWTYVFNEGMRNVPAGRGGASYGSMTAAGLASLYICGQRLMIGGPKTLNAQGEYPSCGKYEQNVAIAKGLEWFAKNFKVRENPGRGAGYLYYYLYGLERVGMISGRRFMGTHDWYREGAAFLVSAQRPNGDWGAAYDTAFCTLFLAKGNRPVLFQKVVWNGKDGKEGNWNRNIHDLENLTAFIADKLGKTTTWQTTTLDPPVQDLRVSPVLLITGHEFPAFTDAQKEKLKAFVDSGGTLLFEACCSKIDFTRGFREFAKAVWPEYADKTTGSRPLRLDHPVFNSFYTLKDTYGLEGIDVGCRTSVFFSPKTLDALWEMNDYEDTARGKLSEMALRLGTNLAAYATGREQLANKLDKVELPAGVKAAAQPAEVPRGALRIARLKHDGEFNADPHSLVNLAALLRDKANVDVVAKDRVMDATDEKIYEYPVLFMTGHNGFKLSDKEVEALRDYLNRGGFLLADACCGQKAFDASFREMVGKLFPDAEFRQVPDDHPVYTGKIGMALGEVHYRQILAEQLKSAGEPNWRGTTRPPLEAVAVKGRTVLLYSKYDFTCALEGDNPFSCRGYIDADGQRLAINLMLFAMSY
ncbi:MAG: DUF4159 domain-containing protein [Phycisphaerae bacterium]